MSAPYPKLSTSAHAPLLKGITDRRLGLFTRGHFASQNLSSILERQRVSGEEWVRMTIWTAPNQGKPGFHEAQQSLRASSERYTRGYQVGPTWTNAWVNIEITIPEAYQQSEEPVIFEFDPSCEALLFTPEGQALHGITGGPNSDKDGVIGLQEDRRVEHVIPREAVKAGTYRLVAEVSANAMFGAGRDGYRHQEPDNNKYYALASADLILLNSQANALELDFAILRQVGTDPTREKSSVCQRALKAANDIMNEFGASDHYGTPEEVDAMVQRCRAIAGTVLGPRDEESRKRLCTFDPKSGADAKMWSIGHCHIDTAWLWTYSQTQQKIARSWSTQIDLMDRYPNHSFAASSAQQYVWLEELYPDVFKRVQEKVKSGNWEPVGGSWLEHDCILPSGESLCRQYLYGQRYFMEKFGVRSNLSWCPDTFGYAQVLPQIFRLSGITTFFTQKLSWNNINRFPHSTFNWVGLDGSQVLTHMTPVDTYNGQCNYDELVKGVGDNKNLGVTDECLLLFGNGDGGGGPTPRMLEKLERIGSLALANPEVPQTKIGRPSDFFESVRQKTSNGRELPDWRGELYFELHRGTYTSQTAIKKGNRDLEKALRDLEYFGTLASLADAEYVYPKAELDAAWKDTMLGQFHDVLPGTSIRKANIDTWEMHARHLKIIYALTDKAVSVATGASAAGGSQHSSLIGLDPLRLDRNQVVTVDPAHQSLLGAAVTQESQQGLLVAMEGKAGQACALSTGKPSSAPKAYASGDAHILENQDFKLVISKGRITSLVDLQLERELITPGSSAVDGGLMIYDDFPLAYDAWDAEIYHLDCAHTIKFDTVEVAANGPLRASLTATARFGKSVVAMTFSLDSVVGQRANVSSRSWIRVDTVADWHEKHKFLKFALPVDIHATNATYDVQFGLLERPTHRNTTQDQAKFEVVAHRYGDLSETGYGVALVADCKYGYAVEGSVMRLSLLRSATAPDAEQDMGQQAFTFGIMPHVGRLQESEIPQNALRFTNDIRIAAVPRVARTFVERVKFTISGPQSAGINLETIKRGEDDEFSSKSAGKTVIMRLFEGLGGRAQGVLKIAGLAAKEVSFVNILEEPMPKGEVEVDWAVNGGSTDIKLGMRGFEIKTIKIVL